MNWTAILGLVFGGGFVGALLAQVIGVWRDNRQLDAQRASELRMDSRGLRDAKRARLAPLYAAAIRSAAEIAESEGRRNYRLEGDNEEELMATLAELKKGAQARLNEVGVPLELESGAEAFNERFLKFRNRYIRLLTSRVSHFPGQLTVTPDINIDLLEDVRELTALAKTHLSLLETPS
jgi:hypothetical protein